MTDFAAWLKAPGSSDETVWFPSPEPGRREVLSVLRDAIRAGRIKGEQIDHLVWQATVTHAELEELLIEIYGPPGAYEARSAGTFEHLAEKMRALRTFIASVPAGQVFELNADEF